MVVDLSNNRLANLQVVDTPGLNTTSDDLETASLRLLGVPEGPETEATSRAVGQVDALVFLLPHARARDVEVLEAAARLLGGRRCRASTPSVCCPASIGWPVKTRTPGPCASDRRSTGRSAAFVGGHRHAGDRTAGRDRRLWLFTESEAGAIRKLAAVDAATRADVLADATEFLTSAKVPLDEPTRRRLFDRLALFGLKVACDAAESGTNTASGLVAVLQETSGFAALMATIERRLLALPDPHRPCGIGRAPAAFVRRSDRAECPSSRCVA